MGLDNKQRQKSCPLCHWLVAADARAADCQGWLILISMKGIGEMYYQEPGPCLGQQHFPSWLLLRSGIRIIQGSLNVDI